ncbi:hypothetical protein FB45DRAFT_913662 [Roridomyces roridus]|uniref:DUF3835 domain-containing protein n=1 Tax=Roridomyces roridus TaxID=1738132 RepID=A0AAD7BYB9_9AGAR|nr:hypothetical protein FB45DRAFT_913662 [Roridomyces roridus]
MSTTNLSEGNAQALQALLQSLVPGAETGPNGKLSSDAARKLSEKLSELHLMGDGDENSQPRDEQGNLLNEEGLPIIEIAEPMNASDVPSPSSLFPDEDPPIPVSRFSVSEQERRRRERDRILDILEAEERKELNQEDRFSPEGKQEILHKRKQAAEKEVARLKAAKDMQKKMGKALLKGLSSSSQEQTVPTQPTEATPRKSVKFAEEETQEWGDVIPARLRPSGGPSLMSNAKADANPMKLHVVERFPGKLTPDEPEADSDDESEPPDSEGDDGFASDEELADEVDLDFAQQQRELTLEYHTGRVKMAETMKFQSLDENEVAPKTAEESLTQPSRKPTISQFQATRLAASSQSLGGKAVSGQTFQRAIRMGKLDSDDRLVGGDGGESGSEDEAEANLQEIMELLKKGEVYNLGPDGGLLTAPPSTTPAAAAEADSAALPPPSSRKPPSSKFKLARPGPRPAVSEPPTPPTTDARSSPKLPTPAVASSSATVMSSTVVEKQPGASVVVSPSFPQSRRPQQPPTVVRASDRPAKVSRFLAERL